MTELGIEAYDSDSSISPGKSARRMQPTVLYLVFALGMAFCFPSKRIRKKTLSVSSLSLSCRRSSLG